MNRKLNHIILSVLLLMSMAAMAQDPTPHVTVNGSVYGGGNKAYVGGNSTVLIDQEDAEIAVDVYGGGALAHVNATITNISGSDTTYGYSGSDTKTMVTLEQGSVGRDIYGGGLGNATKEAMVYGPVQVVVNGGSIGGNVFGCNNVNGTPLDTVTVTINASDPTDDSGGTKVYAIGGVYGGGNQAHYVPVTIVKGYPRVTINGCNTSIENVYGGGKAAGVSQTNVIINGGDISRAFAGGDGDNPGNTPAHVGYKTTNSSPGVGDQYGAANVNGIGDANIHVKGGTIVQVFGGSNKNGKILDSINIDVNKNTGVGACEMHLAEVYGGGNLAPSQSATTFNIGCTGGVGEGIDTLYGGANQANVTGDIVLNITSGRIGNVFGGNNQSGTITGDITVNINKNEGASCASDWYVGNVFGGGNHAAYSDTPDVNIINGTVTGSVFGGGNEASVAGGDVAMTGGTVLGGLYGGCNTSGTVGGDIEVSITNGVVGADGYPASVYGGGFGNGTSTTGDVEVTINGASVVIWGDVYGGSAKGHVNDADTDNTNVTLTAGTIHGDLYGGGHGEKIGVSGGTHNYAATVNGDVQVTVNGGTVTGSVYGCNNINGAPQNDVKVDIYVTDTLGHVFGGGNAAEFGGTPDVTIHNCDNKIGYVYGGGNAASVYGTNVVVYGGNPIGCVFAGGNGEGVAANYTMVTDDAVAYIYGGTIDTVFCGNNSSGLIGGDAEVHINKQTEPGALAPCAMKIGQVYGGGNHAAGKAGTIDIGCTGDLVALGVGEHYGYDQEGIGTVYGGANQANITTSITLDITSGIVENVFGGNNTSGNITGPIQVNINKNESSGCPTHWYVGNVYGGGNLASTTLTPDVNIQNGTVSGSVYGGGNQAGVGGGDVAMTGGTVLGGIYGGCNTSGVVDGNILVSIKGGAVGTQALLNDSIVTNVFGGGYGPHTSTTGNVTVTIDTTSTTVPTIYGDVYGGSALGSVNSDASDKTTVNIYGGLLKADTDIIPIAGSTLSYTAYTGGNVYGGGLGKAVYDTCGRVNGKVIVNIGKYDVISVGDTSFYGYATIEGNVYGANNTNGSPQDDVTVNICGTSHTPGLGGNGVEGTGYALANVFGGGNQANYTAAGKKARVNIKGCDNTIWRVFGGGNAAATPSVKTDIQGGRFYQVYGGGNGERGAWYAADINGRLDLYIHGGDVGQFFGASNQHGTISPGPINVVVDNNGPCEGMVIDEFFCGGNFADIPGSLNTDIDCSEGMVVRSLYGGCNQANVAGNVTLNVYGGTYTNVFGGSKGDLSTLGGGHVDKAANIGGNVTLNLYGGTMENVFGGSNVNGNIGGVIAVNVLDYEDSTCPLNITNIYGGSNLTSYEPDDPSITSPVVNVMHIKNGISGNVYGGSKGVEGTTATVIANPQVNIGYHATTMSGLIPGGYSNPADFPRTIIAGSVFGGGDASSVTGNTEIFLRNRAKVFGNVYGGGNMGEVSGDTKVIVNGENQ